MNHLLDKHRTSSVEFLFRVWVHPEDGDPPDVEVWWQGLESANHTQRFVSDWVYESFGEYFDFREQFDLDKSKHWQVVGKATIKGSYDSHLEYDETIDIEEFEKVEVPQSYFDGMMPRSLNVSSEQR